MAATIVRPNRPGAEPGDEHRLVELVQDLSGVSPLAAFSAFCDAPPAPAEPLERVAHALVMLRHRGGLRIAGYVPRAETRSVRAADVAGFPQLPAGPAWPDQRASSPSATATASSMHASGSANALAWP